MRAHHCVGRAHRCLESRTRAQQRGLREDGKAPRGVPLRTCRRPPLRRARALPPARHAAHDGAAVHATTRLLPPPLRALGPALRRHPLHRLDPHRAVRLELETRRRGAARPEQPRGRTADGARRERLLLELG